MFTVRLYCTVKSQVSSLSRNLAVFLSAQIAISSWPTRRCRRAFLSFTALMASASSQASHALRSCSRAAHASSCMDPRAASMSSCMLTPHSSSAANSKRRSCSTKRLVTFFSAKKHYTFINKLSHVSFIPLTLSK